ncbi:MAG TPA: hypothetical protein PKC28_12685 [Bdellovibrionales bacterium]|nr:hypothetical protein [Bdellovibrionales bacterium]
MKSAWFWLWALPTPAMAQMVEVPDEPSKPATGKARAREYFQTRENEVAPAKAARRPAQEGGTPRYLALHIGSFFTSSAYSWGRNNQEDVGKLNAGLTYRLGEWVNSMDWALRVDYTNYQLDEGSARKLSFGAILTFPDSNSRFPLYFGGGLGAGFFIKQIDDQSAIALDYSLFGGARFLDVIDNLGFMVEVGLKNHLHLLETGQFNGVFINVGTVFAF